MYVTLVVVGGKADKRHLNIKLPAVIGRSRQADLTVAHLLISRRHCELRQDEGIVSLTDLGSLNGTFCGGRKIQTVSLLPNDRFSIGPLTFEIRYNQDVDIELTAHPDAVSAINGPPIELSDPVETFTVELDEPVEADKLAGMSKSGRADMRQARQLPDLAPGRPQTIPGERPWVREAGESIELDSGSAPFDAPTSPSRAPEGDREEGASASDGSQTEKDP